MPLRSDALQAQVAREAGATLEEAQGPEVFAPDAWTFYVAFVGGQSATTAFTVQ